MKAEEAKRLSQLEKEQAWPKTFLAEAELDKAMLKELAEGTFSARRVAGGPSRSSRRVTGHPSGGSASQHTAQSEQACLHRGGEAASSSPRDRR